MSRGVNESVEAHLGHVLARIRPLAALEVPLADAGGLVLAASLEARLPIPAFDNSAMDGYAVRRADVAGAEPDRQVTLSVVAEVAAGSTLDPTIGPGEAVRIMTGAAVPSDADAIVPFEDTDSGARSVRVTAAPKPAAHIRRAGEDVAAGRALIEAGVVLTAARLAAAAAAGHSQLAVRPSPRVAVIVTGSELVDPGTPLRRGQIPESNSVLLAGLVTEAGGTVVRVDHAPDDADAFAAALAGAVAERPDLVVFSGGVGRGDHDIVRTALEPLGSVDFHSVAMQPGSPQAFGTLPGGIIVFGLPGNPVAVAVSFEAFVRPALQLLRGAARTQRRRLAAVAAAGWRSPVARRQYMPIAIDDDADGASRRGLRVRPAAEGGSGSHLVGGLAAADGFAIVETGIDEVRAGDEVQIVLVDG
ncbi:gephyrin-like molybdotransferase Glp [Agromyces sp. NPDC056379]|uniref:molybdopterin molybdotransferase MoeA n=1 Tax=unclassified Agromyces TaxID=2639701 RepID=UPI0035E196A1